MTEPCDLIAVEARRLIGRKQLAPTELLASCIARIEAVDHAVNAMVARDFTRARDAAKAADAAVARGDDLPALHGLPIGIKDLQETAGLRTTFGSPIFRDHVPPARIRAIRFTAPRAIRSIRCAPRPARPAVRRWRWQPGWRRSAPAPTPVV